MRKCNHKNFVVIDRRKYYLEPWYEDNMDSYFETKKSKEYHMNEFKENP